MSDGGAVNNRPPLAQTFKAANGARFSVIVNHLKSKGGCPSGTGVNADNGDGQGCWNGNRLLQAQRGASYFIPAVKSASGADDVLVIGDLNSPGFEDPINLLTGQANGLGLVNPLEKYVRPDGMVFVCVRRPERLPGARAGERLARAPGGGRDRMAQQRRLAGRDRLPF